MADKISAKAALAEFEYVEEAGVCDPDDVIYDLLTGGRFAEACANVRTYLEQQARQEADNEG